MTRAVFFASITSGLTLLATSSFAAGPAMPSTDVYVGTQNASASATIRPMPAPGRMATQLPVTRGRWTVKNILTGKCAQAFHI